MKKIHMIYALFIALLMNCSMAGATTSPTCSPYSIPTPGSIVACGQGYFGSKYTTTSKTCPDGKITVSTVYDLSGCTPSAGGIRQVNKCALTPDECAGVPQAAGCPTGKHWTLLGTNEAHCVLDDPTCGWGTSLTHDSKGNPSCVANTCSSNKVLQGDGISCACPASLPVWDGSTCTPVVTCTPASVNNAAIACGVGFSGSKYTTTTTTCPTGIYGAPSTTTSGYNTSGCTALAVTCNPGSSSSNNASVACTAVLGANWVGSAYTTTTWTTTCPSGSYGSPSTSTSTSGYNTSGCTYSAPPPPPSPVLTTTWTGYVMNYGSAIPVTCSSTSGCTSDGGALPLLNLIGSGLDNPDSREVPITGGMFIGTVTVTNSGTGPAYGVSITAYNSYVNGLGNAHAGQISDQYLIAGPWAAMLGIQPLPAGTFDPTWFILGADRASATSMAVTLQPGKSVSYSPDYYSGNATCFGHTYPTGYVIRTNSSNAPAISPVLGFQVFYVDYSSCG